MTKETSQRPQSEQQLKHLSLGKSVEYNHAYTAKLLQPVPRSISREQIELNEPLPFNGVDIWYGYELSWLNAKGKPHVAILRCEVPFDSPNLIESKSFKLYLNSFNQHKVDSVEQIKTLLSKDLSACAGKPVKLTLFEPEQFSQLRLAEFEGYCIDHLDVEIDHYDLRPDYLTSQGPLVKEVLTSHLLKSNCLITNQPDWASIQIKYEGPQIDHQKLLKYLISFRLHNEFHEQCVERIFADILTRCQPEKLSVYARYTRRGGLDINPFRSNFESVGCDTRCARQ